jgi:hypothetical protein
MINRLPNGYALTPESAPATGASRNLDPATPRGLSGRLLTTAAASIGEHPLASLGVAFATGLLLGKLVKR